jgi:hypothetical protein
MIDEVRDGEPMLEHLLDDLWRRNVRGGGI